MPAAPRLPRIGGQGRAPSAASTAGQVVRHHTTNVVPPVGLSRSAPTVLRAADLRAILAGRRHLPGYEAAPPPSRSHAPRQQVVNITYTVLQSSPAPHGPQPAGPEAAQALGAQLASTAGRISAAATRVEESNPLFTPAQLRAAARRGETVSLQQMKEAEKRHAMAKLIRVLPIGAIARVCDSSVDELAVMDAGRLTHHFITRGRRALWQPGTTNDCRNVWARFMAFLDRHDVVHDGMQFKALDVGDFLEDVDRKARAKGEDKRAKAQALDERDAARARKEGREPPPPRKWQSGETAVKGVTDKLRSIRKAFGISIPIENAAVVRQTGRKPPQPAPALTLGIVFRLYDWVRYVSSTAAAEGVFEAMVNSPAGFKLIASAQVAAGLVFAALSCNRMEQAQSCAFLGEADGYLHGVLLKDKNPNPEKQQARPFWMRLAGPDGGRAWFDFLKKTLAGVEAGCFVLRDFECEDPMRADPGRALRWLNNPLRGTRLVEAIAKTIGSVCCVPYAEACRFTKHSARHFLMEVGGHRDEPATRQVEIGRWSGSTAQDADLTPVQRLAWNHRLAAGVMPDHYAPLAKVQRVCRIIGDQLRALELLWEEHTWGDGPRFSNLPVYGDFTVMKLYPAAAADADDDDDVETY